MSAASEPTGSTEHDIETNLSANPSIRDLLATRLSRREVLRGTAGAAATGFLGVAATVLPEDAAALPAVRARPVLNFTAVGHSLLDQVTLPANHAADVVFRLGDPLAAGVGAYANDGTDVDHDRRAGDHHDGMHYFGLDGAGAPDPTSSTRGLLVMNHENITQVYLHENGATIGGDGLRPVAEAIKEQDVHGVSVVEVQRDGSGVVSYVPDSPFNRRVTPNTVMDIRGPARRSPKLATKFDPSARQTRGTLNNCAHGYTPWGTYLTCEENWAFYFRRSATDAAARTPAENTALARYGIAPGAAGNFGWGRLAADRFARFECSASGASAADDYRNEPNNFGWVVEIDPYDPNAVPVKRTALGRLAREGCTVAPVVEGRPVVFYMGDDSRGEYLFKFVSKARWNPADAVYGGTAGNKYMNEGTLYVARFNGDGTGAWLPLVYGQNGLDENNATYPFADQADVVIHARLAADAVGATKMDRPEWTTVDPVTGDGYLTLTNNSNRGAAHPIDAANPRSYDAVTDANPDLDGNVNGHIIRWREDRRLAHSLTFTWDIYLFGARASYPGAVNISGLDASNDFSSPDGLWFDERGLLWIQTDDGAYTDTTNCMMLAAIPGAVGDGGPAVIGTQGTFVANAGSASPNRLRRFLVGPKGCEITGVVATPDHRTLFVNVQHPGENGSIASLQSTWPDGGAARPRSATIAIRRNDGGEVGGTPRT